MGTRVKRQAPAFRNYPCLPHQPPAVFPDLTPSQLRIIYLVSIGKTTQEMADDQGISHAAIKGRIVKVFKAFGVRSKAHMVACAYRWGYMTAEDEGEGDMSNTAEQRTRAVVAAALDVLKNNEPAILSVTQTADLVANRMDLSPETVRRYLRAGVENGKLMELRPSQTFHVRWPALVAAGITDLRVTADRNFEDGRYRATRLLLATGVTNNRMTPSTYGPGKTTYMISPSHAQETVERLVNERQASSIGREKERQERKKAERAEVNRRHPYLLTRLRRLDLILCSAGDRDNNGRAEWNLHDLLGKDSPITEQSLHITATATGDTVPLLADILETGLWAYLEEQPVIPCVHCKEQVMHFTLGKQDFWWHVASTKAACKGGGTEAAPAEGEA